VNGLEFSHPWYLHSNPWVYLKSVSHLNSNDRYHDGMNLLDFRNTAIDAARQAARIQTFHLGGDLEIETKSTDTDLVTKVDRMCEESIRDTLLGSYPDHTVLGEELGQTSEGSHRWIVDPLDGTLNYAHGFPFFCVSIALEIEGKMEIAVVLDPVRDELFTATRGCGAFLNGRPIQVTNEGILKNSMLATGFAYDPAAAAANIKVFARVLPRVRTVRRPGAAALDLSYVACGRLDAFWEPTLNPWDVAAGMLLVTEAGGTVTNGTGESYQLENPVIVASNTNLHSKLLALINIEEPLG
jgi:myo-inositol-1(or 4)-monophosphatase